MKSKIKLVISLVALFMLPAFITGFENEETYGDTKFKDNVVFYVQHQDDETLWASAAIIEAINEVGADHVYVVQVSYGTGIKVFKNEKVFENMTSQEKYEYREREFLAAVNDLGVKRENVILLPRINNSEVTSFNLMEKTALDFERKFDNVTHVAHSYKYDWHLQHLKNGSTIQSLYNSGKIKHALYFIKPRYEKDLPISEKIIYKSETTMEKQRIKKACMAYKIIDEKSKREGIGYKSDHKSFEDLMIKNRSILHTPNV